MNRDIKPGEWEELETREIDSPVFPNQCQPIVFPQDLIAIYTSFRDQVYNPAFVLYPSCGYDASPSKVFDNIVFVDKEDGNEGCVEALQKEGLNALKMDVRNYKPARLHDLLILLNPAIPSDWATQHLAKGGWVIANDYHGNATELFRDKDNYSLWGTIDFEKQARLAGNYQTIISRDLEGLFEPVKDAKEFERLKPIEFEFTMDMVNGFVRQGIINLPQDASFEEKWAAYRQLIQEGMPRKKDPERYVFKKIK